MSLSRIFAEIGKVLPTNVKNVVGAAEVFGEDGTARVVWVPITEAITSTSGHGGDSSAGMFPGTPSIATREVTCECHVWAASMDLTEQLRDIVHNALQQLIWGSFGITSAKWVDDATVRHGHAYVMTVIIYIPVTRPADFHLHVTAFSQTCEMNFLNGNTETV